MSFWRKLFWYPLSDERVNKTSTKIATTAFCVLVILFAWLVFTTTDKGLPTTEEQIAISNLRTISSAQEAYYKEHGIFGTPEALRKSDFISASLADSMIRSTASHKYRYACAFSEAEWCCVAVPVEIGEGHSRSFFVDQNGIVRCRAHKAADVNEPADTTSPTLDKWHERNKDK